MSRRILITLPAIAAAAFCALTAHADADVIVATDAYRWQGDSIIQGPYKAWAVSPDEIQSTYSARPHYFMPVDKQWKRKNDLSAYPRLKSTNKLHEAVYNMALDEMVNAVEPDTTLRTGKEWSGVWTRDVSYSIILSMAYMQPEASMVSLMKKVNPSGQIIQDTGSGGAWPISTDRMIWVVAAYEIYKVTGDRKWLEKVYPIAVRAIEKNDAVVMSPSGLMKGETSFIDWREQSHPKWMQTKDIARSEAMGTNVAYMQALRATSDMARILGKKKEAALFAEKAERLRDTINKTFWMDSKGYLGMYTYGRDNLILNPRSETLGESLAIIYDAVSPERQKSISENNPMTPYGPGIFYPQISDMPNYHNNALWPFVASYWGLAEAKAGNEQGTLQAIGSVFRPAALFATNKENFNLDNGDIFTELNSSNMLWSLAGNIALTTRILFGIHFENDGLVIKPFVPQALAGTRSLDGFSYRGAKLNITVNGYGANVKSITLNGKALKPGEMIPAKKLKGTCDIVVDMDNEPIPAMKVNNVPNVKAPLTPQTWLTASADYAGAGVPEMNLMQWNPIEYIGHYIILKDGKEVATTRNTSWPVTEAGEWQVIGVAADGTPGFASEPRSNRQAVTADFPGETASARSPEISYRPETPIDGFMGHGFVETDRTSGPVTITVDIPADGVWSVAYRYANGNGPVNTENKAAVRTLIVDGTKAGSIVMPHRGAGNWYDWDMSTSVPVSLEKGRHTLTLEYLPEDENMNIATNHALLDRVVVTRVK